MKSVVPVSDTTDVENKPVHNESGTLDESCNSLNNINIFNEKELVVAENVLSKIMRSDKGGIKSVNDGIALLMRAKDLNLPFSTCIEHVHVLDGKTGIDIHIIKALLSRSGSIVWTQTKDYQPVYEYTDGYSAYNETKLPDFAVKCKNKQEAEEKTKDDADHMYVYPVRWYQDLSGSIYREYQLNSKQFAVVPNQQIAKTNPVQGKIPVWRIINQPIDYVTEYVFKRLKKYGDGYIEVSSTGKFSHSEAQSAGFFDKGTYQKYARTMIGHRAFIYGARDIASDLLMGVMETTELKQIHNIDIQDSDVVQ